MTRTAQVLLLVCLLGLLAAGPVAAQGTNQPVVAEPRPGEALQGKLTITGSSDVSGFLSSEIAFAYVTGASGVWFVIATSDHPVENGTLATWDTTHVADGDCILRLRVTLNDGSYIDAVVSGLRVRNYTLVETSTATPFTLQATRAPTAMPTAALYPTPTPLPPNPAELTSLNVWKSIGYGGLGAVVLFILFGFYLWLRRKIP